MTLSYQLQYSAFGYERAGGGKLTFWRSRKKPGVMDFRSFLPKLMRGEILSPFYLARDREGWFLSGQGLDVPLALSVLNRYHAFKLWYLKVTLQPEEMSALR